MSVSGQNGRFYFNLFEKVERTTGSSIPRYAKDECDGVAAKYANDIVVPKAATGGDRHVTLGDLYKDKQNAMLVSIHEGILKQCFYKRIILVGDSFHKVCHASHGDHLNKVLTVSNNYTRALRFSVKEEITA